MTQPGELFGIGVGPGDPELLTLKALRILRRADVVAYFVAPGKSSISLSVVREHLSPSTSLLEMKYPVTTRGVDPGEYRRVTDAFYDLQAQRLAAMVADGLCVVVLSEGDPSIYGSYMHLHRRLAAQYQPTIVAGVTSISAACAAMGVSLCEGTDHVSIVPGTATQADLTRALRNSDAAVVMKMGRTFDRVAAALTDAGVADRAVVVERASTVNQRVTPFPSAAVGGSPYMSVVVVPSTHQNPPRQIVAESESAGRPVDPLAATERQWETLDDVGQVTVVGLGPGGKDLITPQVSRVLAQADDVVGYATYVDRVDLKPGQRRHASDNRVESERSAFALDLASRGRNVVVVSAGDPGVFAMASAVIEVAAQPEWSHIPVRVLPGVSAAQAVAARVGAPLGHDFATISLSNQLKSWDVIEKRLRAVAEADMVIALYNPASHSRREQIRMAKTVLLEVRSPQTVVIIGRDVTGPEDSVTVTTLAEFDPETIDMRCLVIIGSTHTRVGTVGGEPNTVWTERRYG